MAGCTYRLTGKFAVSLPTARCSAYDPISTGQGRMTEILGDELRQIFHRFNTAQRLPTMSLAEIDEMEVRKHDLEFQVNLCKRMMAQGQFLPFAFDRAAILLRKA